MKKILLGFLLCSFGITVNAQTYVNANATGANNGTSWANAYTDLHSATYNTTSGEIWVAQGTYVPSKTFTNTIPVNTSLKTFRVQFNVQVYGGFNGTETALNQRDWKNNPTIISGDVGGGFKAYNVIRFDGNNSTTILDGFTVQDGRANGTTEKLGGAINSANASPTIRNCKFLNNNAQQHGGATYLSGGTPKFENCEFKNNTTTQYDGGALYINGATSTTIVNCLFNGNIAARYGGAVVIINVTTSQVNNCTFVNNQRGSGGLGAAVFLSATVGTPVMTINNCVFYNNLPSNLGSVTLNAGNYTVKNSYSNVGASCFEYNSGLINIVTGTPYFTDFTGGDYTLSCNSPAVNAGDTIGLIIPSTDLNGNPRVTNTSIDMGAYENTLTTQTSLNANQISSNQAGATYRWLDCNNSYAVISGETAQTFSPTVNGNYAVEITLNGCTDTSACVNITTVGINNINKTNMSISPNPVKDYLFINGNEQVIKATIFTINGSLVQTLNTLDNKINVSNLSQGMYILVVHTDKGITQNKFVKE